MSCYYLSKHSGLASHLDHYKNNREAFEWWRGGGVGGGGVEEGVHFTRQTAQLSPQFTDK